VKENWESLKKIDDGTIKVAPSKQNKKLHFGVHSLTTLGRVVVEEKNGHTL